MYEPVSNIARIKTESLTHALDWMLLRRKVIELETGSGHVDVDILVDAYIRSYPNNISPEN